MELEFALTNMWISLQFLGGDAYIVQPDSHYVRPCIDEDRIRCLETICIHHNIYRISFEDLRFSTVVSERLEWWCVTRQSRPSFSYQRFFCFMFWFSLLSREPFHRWMSWLCDLFQDNYHIAGISLEDYQFLIFDIEWWCDAISKRDDVI